MEVEKCGFLRATDQLSSRSQRQFIQKRSLSAQALRTLSHFCNNSSFSIPMHAPCTPASPPSADCLRTPETIHEPDPRTALFGFPESLTLAEHQAEIAAICLLHEVPEKVAVAFETARNLYLYAWHVFRFYPVAQMQALAALEMGLRHCLPERLPEQYQRHWHKRPVLAGLLGYAIDQGLLQNTGFSRWHAAAERKARQRRDWDAMHRLLEEQLDKLEVEDDAPLEITPEDQAWDLLAVLRETLPHARNELAHGSPSLTRQVRGDIELVAEILNQLHAQSRSESAYDPPM